jgi:transcriptional regulator with XRE-family HTH domain
MTSGERIKRAREARGFGLNKAAVLTNGVVSPATWSRIENNLSTKPLTRTRAAIAHVVGLPIEKLWPPRPENWTALLTAEARYVRDHETPTRWTVYQTRLARVLDAHDPRHSDRELDELREMAGER